MQRDWHAPVFMVFPRCVFCKMSWVCCEEGSVAYALPSLLVVLPCPLALYLCEVRFVVFKVVCVWGYQHQILCPVLYCSD